MSRNRQGKIATDGVGSIAAETPFAQLSSNEKLGGLPERKVTAKATASSTKKKLVRKGRVEIRREKAGRGGKTVTTISGFSTNISFDEVSELSNKLKKQCASGGRSKERLIEIQGDVRDQVAATLTKHGFQPVMAGG